MNYTAPRWGPRFGSNGTDNSLLAAREGDRSVYIYNLREDRNSGINLLVCDEDFVGRDEVCRGDRLVRLPLLESLDVIHEDDEVLGRSLVVDFGRSSSALHHDCGIVLCLLGVCRKKKFREKW